MSPQESRGQAPRSFDPEAEQEVDFGRYWRLLGARWWVVAAGFVVGAKVGRYAHAQIESYRRQIGSEEKEIKAINAGNQSPGVSSTDKLLLQVQLHSAQDDLTTATQLLHQATDVEAPKVLTPAAAQRV